MKYEFITPKEKEIEELIELSRLWVKEDCSYGMVENTADDISEPLLVARDKGKIIGYIFGHPYIQEKKHLTSRVVVIVFSLMNYMF